MQKIRDEFLLAEERTNKAIQVSMKKEVEPKTAIENEENQMLNSHEIKEEKRVLKSKPVKFWFALTNDCNLQCAHCPSNVYGRRKYNKVDEKVYDYVVKEVLPYAKNCLLGGASLGETLLSKDLHKFLDECNRNSVKVSLTTNGTAVKEESISKLIENCDVIGFSMEGMGKEYEKIRHFKWEKFLKNVNKFIEAKRKTKIKEPRLEFRFTAHADNIKQLPELVEFSNSIGIDRLQVMLLRDYVKAQRFKTLYYNRNSANKYFKEAEEKAKKLNFCLSLPSKAFDTGSFEEEKKIEINDKPCYSPWQTVVIDGIGNVRVCCAYYKIAGNLKKNSFDKIWNGKFFKNLRKTVNKNPNEICFFCKNPILLDLENRDRSLGSSINNINNYFKTKVNEKIPIFKIKYTT